MPIVVISGDGQWSEQLSAGGGTVPGDPGAAETGGGWTGGESGASGLGDPVLLSDEAYADPGAEKRLCELFV